MNPRPEEMLTNDQIIDYLTRYKRSTVTLSVDRARQLLNIYPFDLTWEARGSTWVTITRNIWSSTLPLE